MATGTSSTPAEGGGIADSGEALNLIGVMLTNNKAAGAAGTSTSAGGTAIGGGLYAAGAQVMLQGTTVSGNVAAGGDVSYSAKSSGAGGSAAGGGLYISGGSLSLLPDTNGNPTSILQNGAAGGYGGSRPKTAAPAGRRQAADCTSAEARSV